MPEPRIHYQTDRATLWHGDLKTTLPQLADNSIDSVVTDPPYDLTNRVPDVLVCSECNRIMGGRDGNVDACPRCGGALVRQRKARQGEGGFMGKKWDGTGVAFEVDTWQAVYRVLKPGGYLLAFGGTRTFHRMTCAIEDAGFEIRDCLSWMYGQGFPKSLDISKSIDRQAGAERVNRPDPRWSERYPNGNGGSGSEKIGQAAHVTGSPLLTSDPITDEAKKWSGWQTALKPAWEPIIMARKPLAEPTVAANVLEYGTGAINVDGCRIHTAGSEAKEYTVKRLKPGATLEKTGGIWRPESDEALPWEQGREYNGVTKDGRWPANLALSHTEDCQQVGTRKVKNKAGSVNGKEPSSKTDNTFGDYNVRSPFGRHGDADGMETVEAWQCTDECPVRLLDEQSGERPGCKSPSKAIGPESIFRPSQGGYQTQGPIYPDTGGASRFYYTSKASRSERRGSKHPTVKPLALMRWLVRMVTPPGGTTLDPFAGSGTTLEAALLEGFSTVGVELQAEYLPDIVQRIEAPGIKAVEIVTVPESAQPGEPEKLVTSIETARVKLKQTSFLEAV